MYYEDYYEQEPSEVDGIVEDAVEQIVQIIKDKAKEEVDSILDRAKHYEKLWNRVKLENNKLCDELRQKDSQISNLKEDIQKKRTSLNQIPFEVGEEAYFIPTNKSQRINCPECNGKGKKILEMNGETYHCECPKCHGQLYGANPKKYIDYYTFSPEKNVIKAINVHIDKKGIRYKYYFDRYSSYFEEVFKTYDEAKEYSDKRNKESYEEALLKLEGKE